MSCSSEQKQVLYKIANVSFSSQRPRPSIFYILVQTYLGEGKKELLYLQMHSKLQVVDGQTVCTLFEAKPEIRYLIIMFGPPMVQMPISCCVLCDLFFVCIHFNEILKKII